MGSKNEVITFDPNGLKVIDTFKITEDKNESVYDIKALPDRMKLTGPYELHPDTHILSSRHRPDAELQRAGHADLVETPGGETYMVYLCGRPLRNRGRCVLGRETAIQKVVWGKDDWLRTLDGQGIPTLETPAPKLPAPRFCPNGVDRGEGTVGKAKERAITAARLTSAALDRITAEYLEEQIGHRVNIDVRYDFDEHELPIDFQWLRTPWPEAIFSLTARPGFVRLFGRETIGSLFRQSLVARRQQSHC